MIVKVIASTDGKFIGQEFDIPDVTKEVCSSMGFPPQSITKNGKKYRVRNVNYTLVLEKIKD